jgi:uncharacterized membrane protein YhhN
MRRIGLHGDAPSHGGGLDDRYPDPDCGRTSAFGGSCFSGALLFYVSDIFFARQRFVVRQYVARLAGLPLYYAAQFMIAFSIRLF